MRPMRARIAATGNTKTFGPQTQSIQLLDHFHGGHLVISNYCMSTVYCITVCIYIYISIELLYVWLYLIIVWQSFKTHFKSFQQTPRQVPRLPSRQGLNTTARDSRGVASGRRIPSAFNCFRGIHAFLDVPIHVYSAHMFFHWIAACCFCAGSCPAVNRPSARPPGRREKIRPFCACLET